MEDMHYIQIAILNKLLYKDNATYTNLRPFDDLENNLFNFHLKKLISLGYVKKEDKSYALTNKGKESASIIDNDSKKIQRQGKILVAFCCVRENDGRKQVLLYKRLKHPFYNNQGFPSGKVKFGETINESVIRELKEETNLVITKKAELFLIKHVVVKNLSGEIIDDKYFYNFKIENPKGDLQSNEEGEFKWVDVQKIDDFVKKPFDSLEEFKMTYELLLSDSINIKIVEASKYLENY
ncbi:MAG: NUDIX domain-containing protein [Candidatus Dojkabacteria bacterium]|nr:NUDIX domain-containing protein [Candidatus Dojkabacteria bacterium]MDQ7020835.1 NUDIX domain-containing protein [Candidatus Dojkabacteria bacterium]